ncbi:MAG: ribonuclease P protein component [Alphaproteobacteria bacterium]|jgi:ribonuclease P protein component|nr:ribonuclease P protein component [Alphaproteobacteria bacterium]
MKKMRFQKYTSHIIPLKSRVKDFLRISPVKSTKELKKYKLEGQEFKSSSWTSEGFSISAAKTRFDDKHFHVGFIATKKSISKSAVKRNKAKRILRSLVNENIDRKNPDLKNFDFTFVAKSKILELDRSKLEKDFKWAMDKVIKKYNEEHK